MKVEMVCRKCGSTDVGSDASAVWSVEQQAWVLGGTYDTEWCQGCEAEGHDLLIEREIQEVPSEQ